MSVLNSSWPHGGESLTTQEPGPPENLDSDPGHLSEEDPEETFAQNPEVLGLGLPGLDTNPANWPGLRTLLQQLPPQDSSERYCLALGEEELAELRLFCAQRRREALGQGVARLVPPKLKECTCEKCREQMRPGEYGVFAARAGERRCWHQACFACQACGQALINLIYFYHNGRLYCGRHHAELLRPRCPACDQLIFSPRCTEAEGRRWHENHFCCQDCAGPLGGGRYALPGGGPCCPSCFESRYLNAGLSPAPAMEGRASLGKRGKVQIKREGGSGLGWAEEGILPGWDPRPDPTPSRPSSSAPDPNRTSQTRISGPAALTARPRPERSKGLPNPPRAAASTAARHSAPVLGTRPPSGGRRRGGAGSPGEESPRRRRARPGGGAGAWVWLQWAAPQGCG
ncbi:prickle-like protein 4 isoform X1 [Pteropus vampyrus]|uniref:Prickle-like protein 4 isoform X1 n=1 Tax=Pteropus vampyrus TaxID=132908 RepID=A0A6P6C7M5_PTEVA|nr:prickle-like protein 4 isoform X1 [Pteropus vampyrus]XP_023383362.1 prickle-like protein 4 isoform X1 [Pteropus vampyrus]XP_023383363.1 prickle-like protein 4 isoform X1 [Pteropus vampyrus]XP_023383364.1 prickle-like protein 4 isoform X1 [Pteropus vampyrus]XP_023383365.1 prickle-like protein 4 isoform X1 [Pteropus vampyrus]